MLPFINYPSSSYYDFAAVFLKWIKTHRYLYHFVIFFLLLYHKIQQFVELYIISYPKNKQEKTGIWPVVRIFLPYPDDTYIIR